MAARRLARAREMRAPEDLGDVGVPAELVALFLPGGQVATDEAEAGAVQRHADGDAALVAEPPHDAPADAVHAEVADVLHHLSLHPHRQEQPHHLLARDQAVVHAAAAAAGLALRRRRAVGVVRFDVAAPVGGRLGGCGGARGRRVDLSLCAVHGRADIRRPAAHGGRLDGAVAGLDERAVDAVAVAEHLERRRLEEEGRGVAAAVVAAPRVGRRRLVVVAVIGLLLGLVEGLVDERQPPGCRLVVLQDQHVAGGQGNYLLKPTLVASDSEIGELTIGENPANSNLWCAKCGLTPRRKYQGILQPEENPAG